MLWRLMSKVRFELNRRGVGELLKSQEMKDVLSSYAADIQGRVGGSYQTDVKQMRTRAIASVFTKEPGEIQDNFDNNTLWRATR